jgi:hypothetical protein
MESGSKRFRSIGGAVVERVRRSPAEPLRGAHRRSVHRASDAGLVDGHAPSAAENRTEIQNKLRNERAGVRDEGCFEVHLERWQPAIEALMKTVAGIKGRGDKPGAQKLIATYVDAKEAWAELRKTTTERWLPFGAFRLFHPQ